jgi:hypothetical protein
MARNGIGCLPQKCSESDHENIRASYFNWLGEHELEKPRESFGPPLASTAAARSIDVC